MAVCEALFAARPVTALWMHLSLPHIRQQDSLERASTHGVRLLLQAMA